MTLSSTSTLVEVEAEYDDNASYRQNDSATQCAAFITACTILLRRYAQEASSSGGSSMVRNMDVIQGELEGAKTWQASNPDLNATGMAVSLSFENMR